MSRPEDDLTYDIEYLRLRVQEDEDAGLGEVSAWHNLGLLWEEVGEFEQAASAFAKALEAAKIYDDAEDEALAAQSGQVKDLCALVHGERSDWQALHRDGGRAWRLALLESYNDLRARLSLLWGREALAQGDDKAAADHWREALETASQVSKQEHGRIVAELERLLSSLPYLRRRKVKRLMGGTTRMQRVAATMNREHEDA